jgi:hypothetical protein
MWQSANLTISLENLKFTSQGPWLDRTFKQAVPDITGAGDKIGRDRAPG